MKSIPPPEPHRLLPPLLACLPTSFASHHPPPALLALVSPILRQRLQHLNSTSTSSSNSWLELLCWDNAKAEKLTTAVESGTYEPHPVSGEIEVGDSETTKFKRLDQETLHAQIELPDWLLIAKYLWCGETEEGNGWALAELLPFDRDLTHDGSWWPSIEEANDTFQHHKTSTVLLEDAEPEERPSVQGGEEDDYWARYDMTPAQSPMQHPSATTGVENREQETCAAEADYYARCGNVQPAMDRYDPSEEPFIQSRSSSAANILSSSRRPQDGLTERRVMESQGNLVSRGSSASAAGSFVSKAQQSQLLSSNSEILKRPEQRVARDSESEPRIRQHISVTIKSLYELARSTGIQADEFMRLTKRQVEDNDEQYF